jgi:hypothetical protein
MGWKTCSACRMWNTGSGAEDEVANGSPRVGVGSSRAVARVGPAGGNKHGGAPSDMEAEEDAGGRGEGTDMRVVAKADADGARGHAFARRAGSGNPARPRSGENHGPACKH